MKLLAASFLASLTLAGAAQARETEELLGLIVDETGIHYQVASGGCTGRDDFELLQLETFPVQLRLERLQPACGLCACVF